MIDFQHLRFFNANFCQQIVSEGLKNLNYEALVDCMHQNPQGLMEYREQVVVFRKDDINHIAWIITYVDIKKGKSPNSSRC